MTPSLQRRLAAVVVAVALAVAMGGCSAKNSEPEKTSESPPVISPADEAINAQLVQNVQWLSTLAMLQLTTAMLQPMGGVELVPSPADAPVGSSPAFSSPEAQPAAFPAAAEAPVTVVNNYYVQQVVAAEPVAVPAAAPTLQPVYVTGGLFVPAGRNGRGPGTVVPTAPTPLAPSPAAPSGQIFSSASQVARALPLNVGNTVARGSTIVIPNTTGVLPNPPPAGTGSTSSTSQTQGGRRGGG